VDQLLWIAFGFVLDGASAFALVWFVRKAVSLTAPRVADGEPFKVVLRALAVAFGLAVGYLGRGSLFPGLQALPAALLGGLAGYCARDAYDAFKAAKGAARSRALEAIAGGKAESDGA
jgi:hypothetical protein